MGAFKDPLHPTDEERQAARERLTASSSRTRAPTGLTPISSSISPLTDDLADLVARAKERNAAFARAEALRREVARATFAGECFDCRDTGWLVGALNVSCPECPRGRAVEAEQARSRFQALWKEAAVTPRCQAFSLSSFPDQAATVRGEDGGERPTSLARVWAFLEGWDGRRGLMLTGPYGTGKTGLMVGALRHVAERQAAEPERRRVRLLFTTGTDLMDALRRAIAQERETHHAGDYDAVLGTVKRVGLLAIDDLGAEKPTEFVQERLFAILNHRYEHELPTFTTTNYGLGQLAARVGERVVDRLIETSDVLAVEGANLRRERPPRPRKGGHAA